MIRRFKQYIERRPVLFWYISNLMNIFIPIRGFNNKIIKNGASIKCKILIHGNNNTIILGSDSVICNTLFHIYGDNNLIEIGQKCKIFEETSLWIDGNNNSIILGEKTSIRSAHLCAQEGERITIGKRCMLSNTIEIRTSDSHSIYANETLERINPPKSVTISDDVWISAKTVIMKGVTIKSGSVIGYGSMVTKDVPPGVVVAGRPAKIIKENIIWRR